VNLSHSLGIAWYDAGSDPEFDPTMTVGMTEASAMLKSPVEKVPEDEGRRPSYRFAPSACSF
jgi:hypothetical protein